MSRNEYAMPIIEEAIAKARQHPDCPLPDAADYDSWIAFIIVNEMRLAGWKIVPPEGWSLRESILGKPDR
jgi:hypothetical protein